MSDLDRAAYRLGLFDVRDAMPADWHAQLLSLARSGRFVDLPGMDLGSIRTDQRPLKYRVTPGEAIQELVPWLWSLYLGLFRDLASSIAGARVDVARDVESAVNLNYMAGLEDSYEWHLDTNAVTGLLFVTSHDRNKGGILLFDSDELGVTASLAPRAGWLAAFDGRQVTHAVESLTSADDERVTVPMNYYAPGDEQIRQKGLSEHVYGKDGGSEIDRP